MIYNVITEGKTDAEILRRLLEPEVRSPDRKILFTSAGGWSLAESTARSILAIRKEPVALVVDADSTRPDRVEERRRFLEESLGEVAPRSRFRVILFVPEIEILFFQRDVIKQLLGASRKLSDADRIRAEYEPRRVLESLQLDQETISRKLSQLNLEPLKDHKVLADLRSFVLGTNDARAARKRAGANG